jgi:hypothetical protein
VFATQGQLLQATDASLALHVPFQLIMCYILLLGLPSLLFLLQAVHQLLLQACQAQSQEAFLWQQAGPC